MAKNTINKKSFENVNEKISLDKDYSNDNIIFDKKIRNILSQFNAI
jgi:hypothetical protein